MNILKYFKRKTKPNLLQQLEDDYGSPDVLGPWTKFEPCVEGEIKFYKSMWFITSDIDKSPNIDIVEDDEL